MRNRRWWAARDLNLWRYVEPNQLVLGQLKVRETNPR